MTKNVLIAVVLLFSFSMQSYAQTATVHPANKKEAKKWFKKKEWLGGVQLKPHKSIDVLEFYRQYTANKMEWDKAFAFLKAHDLNTLANGKYPIDGENIFATVSETRSKNIDSTQWESHRKYIDIQCMIDGQELMGVSPVIESTVTKPYDEKRDAANYSAGGKLYKWKSGTFFIFFPGDAHRPNITAGSKKPVKKIVIKVRVKD